TDVTSTAVTETTTDITSTPLSTTTTDSPTTHVSTTTSEATTSSLNCQNGGNWTGQVCLCPNGFSGKFCEKRVPVVICQNGGLWDGLKCQCTGLFHGPRCEDVDNIEIEKNISATMEVTVKITGRNYSEELNNRTSEAFKVFNKTFTEQMDSIYKGIQGYEGVIIRSLREGSIVVDYDVILKATYTPEYESVLEEISKTVEQTTVNATKEDPVSKNCSVSLCFNPKDTRVQNLSLTVDPKKACQEKAGEDFAKFVTLEEKDNKLYCVTPCSTGYKISRNCNYGKCQLQRSGPQCLCLTTDTHWYSGENCDWGVQKSLVYGLVGGGVAVLLVILVILFVFSIRFRREARRQRSKVSEMYKWGEEEGRTTPGACYNVGFEHNEERENYVPLGSVYSNFQPSLNRINPEGKMQIQRPQVVMTSL
ncbi:mucin-17-like, partial [Acomys russatus]|uniref:mucin-17-like n=1 Tax=Acomys russatus TaxID=60746 RepID=UPI0021E32BAE